MSWGDLVWPPWGLNFFRAVRMLEATDVARRAREHLAEPHRVGEGADPELDPVRFTSEVSAAFPAGELADVDPEPLDGEAPSLKVRFFGLAGARGPLPAFYTQKVLDRLKRGDTGLRDFLDIFNHRLISLFYRARYQARPELEARDPYAHPMGQMIMAFAGAGAPSAQAALEDDFAAEGIDPRIVASIAGLLWRQDRPLEGLLALLKHNFGDKGPEFSGRAFSGRWLKIEDEDRSRLGARMGQFNTLGQDLVLGGRAFDPQSAFELTVGLINPDMLESWLPSAGEGPAGRAFAALVRLVHMYTRNTLDFSLVLLVEEAAVYPRRPRLGAPGLRLGWTSWLATMPPREGRIRRIHISPTHTALTAL